MPGPGAWETDFLKPPYSELSSHVYMALRDMVLIGTCTYKWAVRLGGIFRMDIDCSVSRNGCGLKEREGEGGGLQAGLAEFHGVCLCVYRYNVDMRPSL